MEHNQLHSRHIVADLEFADDLELRPEAIEQLQMRLAESPIDVREALASYTPDADADQSAVIESSGRTIRVLAPAGSGKTQTVVNRVLAIIRKGVHPKRILVLTFDNAAVGAINGKFNQKLEDNQVALSDRPTVSTLNAFGYAVLREFVPSEYKLVIPDYRSRRLLREIKEALRQKSPGRYAALPQNLADNLYLEFFSVLKNALFDPRSPNTQRLADFIVEKAKDAFFVSSDEQTVLKVVQGLIWLYMAYGIALQREDVLDFDDQKLRAYLSLAQDEQLLTTLQGRYTEVLVDEFQDINLLDSAFVKAIAGKSRLVVFGDDDQAIYGFRGCTPDYIIDLEAHLGRPPVTSHELRVNYRCPPNIVEHANRLIRHNSRRVEKYPIANRKDPAEIKVVSSLSAAVEARLAVSFIRRVKRASPSLQHSDFAVLYRTNAQSLPLQIEFLLNDLPYYVREQDNLLSNRILDRLLGVLRLKIAISAGRSPTPDDAVLAVQAYLPYVSARDVERLHALFSRGRPFLGVIGSQEFSEALSTVRQGSLILAVRGVVEAVSLMNTLDVLAKDFKGLRGMVGSLEDVIEERVPLGEIYELAATYEGRTEEFVRTIEKALERAKATGAGKHRDDGIALLTYFRAKGLQWHTVILTTCNEGLIPHKRALVEEERRLFYVALTRASSNLLISYVKNACNNKVLPSRFLQEAGLLNP
ncbi:MAG: ATP-dependent helicase [Chloroflexi bacterium]|nr:ATP-dependent helicase [Chloroflexota bacterium]